MAPRSPTPSTASTATPSPTTSATPRCSSGNSRRQDDLWVQKVYPVYLCQSRDHSAAPPSSPTAGQTTPPQTSHERKPNIHTHNANEVTNPVTNPRPLPEPLAPKQRTAPEQTLQIQVTYNRSGHTTLTSARSVATKRNQPGKQPQQPYEPRTRDLSPVGSQVPANTISESAPSVESTRRPPTHSRAPQSAPSSPPAARPLHL
jgi:hypothetical protein